jgi:uncharacterized protein (TIGR02246 family)
MKSNISFQHCVLTIFALVLLIACSPVEQQSDQSADAAVNEIWQRYSASLNSGDLDAWLALWTQEGVQLPPGEPAVIGKDQIRARNKAVLDRFTFDMGITNEEVGSAGDWAFARGTYKATLTPKAGGELVHVDGKYMTILKKQADGSWKIHRDIFNSNVT